MDGDLLKGEMCGGTIKFDSARLCLKFIKATSQEDVLEAAKQFDWVTEVGKFCLGDLWNYGCNRWGQDFADSINGKDAKVIHQWKQYARVSGAVHPNRRRHQLTYTHHKHVAALLPEQQDRLLNEAIEHEMTAEQVQLAARDLKGENKPLTDKPTKSAVLGILRECAGALAELHHETRNPCDGDRTETKGFYRASTALAQWQDVRD